MPSGLRGGGYLLFHFRSIIGVARFNFSVRNGDHLVPNQVRYRTALRPDFECKVKKKT